MKDGHGILLYQSTLHVPFIMRVPGLAPGRVADVTRLVDMMPTVLDFLHVPAPSMDGVSLVALMKGRVKHLDLDAYSESAYPRRFGWSELQALRAGRYKFINAPRPSCTISMWILASGTTSSTSGRRWVQSWPQEWMRSHSPLPCAIQWRVPSMLKRRPDWPLSDT